MSSFQNSDGFLVEKGSRLSPDITERFKTMHILYAQRLYLIAEHIVDEDYVFTRDYTFLSAATAAAVVSGMQGRTDMWKEP